jgi:hypothetical protein
MCKEIEACLPPILLFVESVFEAAVERILEIKAAVEVEGAMCQGRYQGRGGT